MPYVDDPFANWNKPVAAPAVDPFANWNQPDQTVLWAGRPVTKSAVDRAAAARGVSPDTIMELGTPAGRFEAAFAQSAVGQTVLRAGEGIKQISETVTANLARAAGRGDIAARIHNDRNQRNEFLSFAEQGGDLSSVLGERANRIYNQTTQSLGNVGATAVLTGPVGVYSMMAADAWESGLDEAQRAGLAGVASIGHAARKATIEGGVTFLMGRIPGVASLEESFSPAMRNAAAKQLEKAGVSGLLQKLGGEAGGIAAEAAEEVFIAGGQQLNEMSAGLRKEFDWSDILDAGLSGAAARGAVGTSVKLNNALRGIEKSLPDVSKGTRAAEIDVERGINPFEIRELDGKELDKQTGRTFASKAERDSYRDALNFYIDEARKNGETGALDKLEKDAASLAEERAQQEARKAAAKKSKGRAGESTVKTEPVKEQPIRTANERAKYSIEDFNSRVRPVAKPPVVQLPEINPFNKAPWESRTRLERRFEKAAERLVEWRVKVDDMRHTVKEEKRLREEQLTAAADFVRENVPPAEQGRFFGAIRKAKTPAKINQLLDKISKVTDAADHANAKRELKESFRKAKNLRTGFAEQVLGLKQGIDLKKFTIDRRAAAVKLKDWAANNPNAIVTDQDKAAIDRLAQKRAEEMTADELRETSAAVQNLAYQSAVQDKILTGQQQASVRDIGDSIAAESVNTPKRETKSKRMFLREVDRENFKEERTIPSQFFNEWAERPEATISMFGPTAQRHLYDDIAVVAQDDYSKKMRDVTEATGAVLNQLGLGDTSWRDQEKIIQGTRLRRGEAQQVMRWMADPDRAQVLQKAGVVLEDGNRTLPALTPKLIAELQDFVGEDVSRLNEFMFAYDNGALIDSVNDTNEQITGRPVTTKRNVVPSHVADEDYVAFLTAGRTSAGMANAAVDSYGSLKRRGVTSKPLLIPKGMDAIDMFMRHADKMNRFAAFGVPARNSEMLLNDPAVKQRITEKHGTQGYQSIVKAIKSHVVGFDRVPNEHEQTLQRMNAIVAGGHIAMRFSTMAMRPLDAVTAAVWDDHGTADLSEGYSELNQRGFSAVESEIEQVLGEHSGEFWQRYKSDNFAGEETSGQYKRRGYFRPPSISQRVMTPLNRSEYWAAAVPNYLAAKAAARRQFGIPADDVEAHPEIPGWSEFVARAWDRKTYRGSASSHGLELNGALRASKANPVLGLVTTFMNTPSKVYSLFTKAVGERRAGRPSRAYAYLGAGIVNLGVVAAIQEGLFMGERDEEFLSAVLKRFGLGFARLVPIGGEMIAENFVKPWLGMKQYSEVEAPILIQTAIDTGKAATALTMALTERGIQSLDDEKTLDAIQQILVDGSTFYGGPGPSVEDWAKRLSEGTLAPGLDDAIAPQDFAELLQGLGQQ